MPYTDYITEHFEELVIKHGGRYIAVVNEEVVAVGDSPRDVENEAMKRHPGKIPSVMKVPTEDDIVCLL
jgi:hypothetical protein